MLVSVRVKEEASKFCVLLIGQVYLPLIFGRGNPPYRKYLWDWFLHQHKRHGSWFWTFWEGTFLVVKSNLYFLDEGTTYWPTMRHLFEGHLWEPMLHPCMVHLDTYIYHKDQPNLGKYTIHGCYGEFKAASFHIMFVAQKKQALQKSNSDICCITKTKMTTTSWTPSSFCRVYTTCTPGK